MRCHACDTQTHGHTDGHWESRAVFSLNWIRNYSEQIQQLRIPAQQSVPPGAGSCTHGGARRGRSAAPGSGPVRPGSSVQDFVGQDFVTDSEDSSSWCWSGFMATSLTFTITFYDYKTLTEHNFLGGVYKHYISSRRILLKGNWTLRIYFSISMQSFYSRPKSL